MTRLGSLTPKVGRYFMLVVLYIGSPSTFWRPAHCFLAIKHELRSSKVFESELLVAHRQHVCIARHLKRKGT